MLMKNIFLVAIVVGTSFLAVSCGNVSREKLRSAAKVVNDVGRHVNGQEGEASVSPGVSYASSETFSSSSVDAADGIEIPAPVKGGNEIVLRRVGYTVSYNSRTRQPNWVAWQLTPMRTKGGNDRKDYKFTPDDDVPAPRAEDSDYRSSGYDRGHMCPAGDNKWKAEAMRQSFLFSNICPHAPSLNRGDWNEMELACRRWAKKYGSVYVVCGPVFYKKSRRKTIGRNKVAVPDAFFKVLLCTEGTPKAIGFIYKNTDGNRPMGDYVNTVDEVERITGYDFFPSLPDKVENKVEATCDLEQW